MSETVLPPHVERFLAEARETLEIMVRSGEEGRNPVKLTLRWKLEGGGFGVLERTYRRGRAVERSRDDAR